MTERELELRLGAFARALDAEAPAFDPATLGTQRRLRVRPAVVALVAAAALMGVPAAISALGDLFAVESVPELGPVAPNVTPAFLGRQAPLSVARAETAFRLRTIPSLGAPSAAYVRDDVVGEMATVAYGEVRVTQWRMTDVTARASVVPVRGTAEEVTVGGVRALWLAGAARGTLDLIGADGAVHHELFEVSPGALLWHDDGVTVLLQGAGTVEHARRLAAELG